MATTQLTREIRYQLPALGREQNTEAQTLRTNGVVVTGRNGRRSLRMQWLRATLLRTR
jgi:hypothetical protein